MRLSGYTQVPFEQTWYSAQVPQLFPLELLEDDALVAVALALELEDALVVLVLDEALLAEELALDAVALDAVAPPIPDALEAVVTVALLVDAVAVPPAPARVLDVAGWPPFPPLPPSV